MFSPQFLENCLNPSRRFLTTYSHDYRPFIQRHPQSTRGVLPNFYGDFYKTSSQPFRSVYNRSQVSDSILPVVTRPFSLSNLREVTREAGQTLPNARTQEVIVPTGTVYSSEEYKKSQRKRAWEEDGVLVWVSPLGLTSFENFLKSYFRKDRLEHLFHPPVEFNQNIASRDAEDRKQRGILWDYSRSTGVKNHPYHQPAFTKCSCCGVEYEHPHHTVAHCSFLPQDHIQPIHHCMQHRRTPQLTEHQASYNAPWFQPKNQQGVYLQHLPH